MQVVDLIRYTPVWVYALLAALVALGVSQMRDREIGLGRLAVMPVVLALLSASGTLSAFGATLPVVLAWAGAALGGFVAGLRAVAIRGARPGRQPGSVRVPGSAIPLVLILALFSIKYVVGVSIALHPARAEALAFAVPFSGLYGLFAGLFLARAASVLRPGGAMRLAAA